jgi:predicted GNAT family N-acyltransferase
MGADSDPFAASKPFPPQSDADWDKYYDLRWRVLRAPWNQPRGSEKDYLETKSQHLMIAGRNAEVLAVGRLHFNSPDEAQVRYMAVAPEAQGRGLGGAILAELERLADAGGATSIVLNARENARGFYKRHGFVVIGPAPTLFDAVPHSRMRKELTPEPRSQDQPGRA